MANTINSPSTRKGLFRSTVAVGMGTLSSRVLGLVRDIVIGHIFGAGGQIDAFLIAFKIPNFLRRLFAEGAFSQAFIPVLAEVKKDSGLPGVRDLMAHISAWLGLWLLVVTTLLIVLAPYVAIIFAPGFWYHGDLVKLAQTADTIRLVSPYLFFISMTALCGAVLNTYGNFAIPAFTPVLLNVCLISFAVFGSSWFEPPIQSLAIAVLFAGMAQLLFQQPSLYRLNVLVRPRLSFQHAGVRKVAKLMIPALLGVSVSQINLLLDTVLASLLVDGSVSWLYYSDRLSELPLGVIGIAIATVVLPVLSNTHMAQDGEQFRATLGWAIKLVVFLGLPASAALFYLSEPLIATIFYHGEMDFHSVEMSSLSLRAYSLGLLAFMLIKVLAPGFYSRQEMKTPVKIAVWSMILNMVFNLMLVYWLKHVGLALATALSAWFNAAALYWFLRRDMTFYIGKDIRVFLLKVLLACMVMIGSLHLLLPVPLFWENQSVLARIYALSGLVCVGICVYFAAVWAFGIRFHHLKR
ncbi:murein biosynthesis integral membrane protein MurJ [Gynuella sp.]|uniref:murein biosynthesis integral membrane protein MurJ n=1 Tax=Gynuella sp. TaxID=2969146 RepID=UPI003D126C89